MKIQTGLSIVLLGAALAPFPAAAKQAAPGITASRCVAVALSRPLRELAAEAPAQVAVPEGEEREVQNFGLAGKGDHSLVESADVVDPVRQLENPIHPGPNRLTDPLASFDGVTANGSLPPDTTGDVGPNHYVQTVNTRMAIYSKAGALLVGPVAINTVFSPLPAADLCRTTNDGDPIVIYDQLADRWLVSQFAVQRLSGRYGLQPVHRNLADRRPDRELVRVRLPLGDRPAQRLSALRPLARRLLRDLQPVRLRIAGLARRRDRRLRARPDAPRTRPPSRSRSTPRPRFPLGNDPYGGHQVVDLEGTNLPAAGEPNRVLEWDNAGWIGDAVDTLRIWEVHLDWMTPANSTFGLNASFDANFLLAPAEATVLADVGCPRHPRLYPPAGHRGQGRRDLGRPVDVSAAPTASSRTMIRCWSRTRSTPAPTSPARAGSRSAMPSARRRSTSRAPTPPTARSPLDGQRHHGWRR